MPFQLRTYFSLKIYLLLTSSFVPIHFDFLFYKQYFFQIAINERMNEQEYNSKLENHLLKAFAKF